MSHEKQNIPSTAHGGLSARIEKHRLIPNGSGEEPEHPRFQLSSGTQEYLLPELTGLSSSEQDILRQRAQQLHEDAQIDDAGNTLGQPRPNERRTSQSTKAITVCIVVLLVVFLAAVWFFSFSSGSNNVVEKDLLSFEDDVSDIAFIPSTPEEKLEVVELVQSERFVLTPEALDTLECPNDSSIVSFSLADITSSSFTGVEELAEVEAAVSALTLQGYPLGYLFMDMGTGRGICSNIDEDIYGASSFKASLAAYVLSNVAETDGLPLQDLSRIEASVLYSDNDSFVSLSNRYRHSDSFSAWLESLLIEKDLFSLGDFATYSVRDSAKMWDYIWDYVQSDGEYSTYLQGLLADTNLSFIRNGLEEWEGDIEIVEVDKDGDEAMYEVSTTIDGVQIYNKAGWIAASIPYNSTSDNAIIEYGGRTYLMCVMCGAPATQSNMDAVSNLARSLFAARSILAG